VAIWIGHKFQNNPGGLFRTRLELYYFDSMLKILLTFYIS